MLNSRPVPKVITAEGDPQACPKCGSKPEVTKAGSNRCWVQCSKFGKNGNCSAISQQGTTKKEAIALWNKLK
ncbi:Lar family restriction alleviation protein [Iodobacter sp. LRB]|uniref:Lar family restriction alleviation protein n=1 Tax=unclassified Iodobacter TaxID=235634 RepID=UPI000C0EB824|nr:Lar family restriction alleviation protein [Iodobacter sp. BJB302]PHV02612.1 hypothetical protein CSQ88_05985 [Iodobacter sp. BJB302]